MRAILRSMLAFLLLAAAATAPASSDSADAAPADTPEAAVASALASLEAIEAPPVILHFAPELRGVAADLAARAPGEVTRVAQALGLPEPARLDVFLLPRRGDKDPGDYGLPGGPDWAAGLALSDRPVVVLRTAESGSESGAGVSTILTHEIVHAVTSAALGATDEELPAWWREGTASHFAYEWRLAQDAHVMGLALSGSYVPLSEIDSSFPQGGGRVPLAYLESFAFVNWLADRSGPDGVRHVFVRVREGAAFLTAFREAFGATPAALEAQWRKGFLWKYRWLPALTSTSTAWVVIVVLIVASGVRKRRESARTLALWADEERLAALAEVEAARAVSEAVGGGGASPDPAADGADPGQRGSQGASGSEPPA